MLPESRSRRRRLLSSLRTLLALCVFISAWLVSAGAFAHPGDKGFATITLSGDTVLYDYLLPLASFHPPPGGGDGSPGNLQYNRVAEAVTSRVSVKLDQVECKGGTAVLSEPAGPGGSIGVRVQFACHTDAGRELWIRDELVEALSPEYVTIASIQWPGGSQQFVFKGDARELRIGLDAGSMLQSVRSFLLLGVEHILLGWDHLLFLLALLLQGGTLIALLKIVTAFTVAHSLTLIGAVLDLIAVPARLVEALIALSIACVAAGNLLGGRDRADARRWPVAFGFGLVHGLGFSSALREAGLPTEGLLWSLLGFNVGVELGQAAMVAIALPVLWKLAGASWWPHASRATSVALVAIGLGVGVQRLVF